jgi:hypothetical protein
MFRCSNLNISMKIDHKHAYKFCIKLFYGLKFIIINIMQNVEVISSKFNIESVHFLGLEEIMNRNGSLNPSVTNT